MIRTLKLVYQDALGTFCNAIVQVNEDLGIVNLDTLPIDLQRGLINGDYDETLHDFEEALTVCN